MISCKSLSVNCVLSEISNDSVISKLSSNLETYSYGDINYTTDYQRRNIDMTVEDDKMVDNVVCYKNY